MFSRRIVKGYCLVGYEFISLIYYFIFSLVRFGGFLKNSQTLQKVNSPFHYMTSVKDPNGTTISRQQVKPDGKILMTAPLTGEYLICMQTMLTQFNPQVYSVRISSFILLSFQTFQTSH